MGNFKLSVALLTLVSSTCFGWERFLSPSDFPELPKSVKAELERINCVIPQTSVVSGLHNVTRGELAKKGQTDWAVLCYSKKDDLSFVKIIWGGKTQCHGNVDKPLHGNAKIHQIYITTEKPEKMKLYDIPSLKHDAIEFNMGNEGSMAYYCNGKSWQGYGSGD